MISAGWATVGSPAIVPSTSGIVLLLNAVVKQMVKKRVICSTSFMYLKRRFAVKILLLPEMFSVVHPDRARVNCRLYFSQKNLEIWRFEFALKPPTRVASRSSSNRWCLPTPGDLCGTEGLSINCGHSSLQRSQYGIGCDRAGAAHEVATWNYRDWRWQSGWHPWEAGWAACCGWFKNHSSRAESW